MPVGSDFGAVCRKTRPEGDETNPSLENGFAGPLLRDNIDGRRLIEWVTDLFDVSSDAARVRLLKLGHLAA